MFFFANFEGDQVASMEWRAETFQKNAGIELISFVGKTLMKTAFCEKHFQFLRAGCCLYTF